MTLHVPRLRFALDPLIGEAKRRARHRRFFIAAALILAAFAIGLTLGLSTGGGGPAPPARRTALQVPRITPFGPAEPFTRLHLPLSLDQPWQIARAGNGTTGYRYGAFRLHGQIYTVFVWNGPSAPPHDRSALLRALGSIRPTH